MNNVEQILLETIKITLVGILGGLIGARANDKFARKRDQDAVIAKDKKDFIFQIDELIETATNCEIPHAVRARFHRLYTPYLMFKPHLKGGRLTGYEEAWKKLQGTTMEEVQGSSPTASYDKASPELHKIQNMIMSRLEALREIVQDT
jgi:hypothetical protein